MRETVMAEDSLSSQLKEVTDQLAAATDEQSRISKARESAEGKNNKKKLTNQLRVHSKELEALNSTKKMLSDKLANLTGLPKLVEDMKVEKKDTLANKTVAQLGNKLESLNGLLSSTDNSKALLKSFEETSERLENPDISSEEKDLLLKQIETIKSSADDEETIRENRRLSEEGNSRLLQMSNGLDNVGDKFDKFSDNFKKGAGLIGALGAIGLMLFSPETLYKIIDSVINFFDGMYKTIQAIIGGDWETAKVLIGENIKGIGIALAGFFAIFGGSIIRGFSSLLKMARSFGQTLGKVGKIFGKIFLPFTIALGAFSAITGFIEGFKEGGLIGGIQGAITNLFDNLVAVPLDFIKNIVSWVLGKLGFENAAEMLESFSFSELFTSMFDSIFGIVGSAVDWVKGVFSNFDIAETMQALWEGLVGEGGLFDILFAPVDMAINWIMGMFAFETPEESFSLREMIGGVVDNVINFFSELFDFLPSLDEISAKLKSILPSWLGGEEPEFNVATANDEQLRAQAKDNAGFFGDEAEEYNKLVEQKKDAIATIETRTRSMIRGSDEDQSNNLIQGSEPTPLAPRIEPATTPGAVLSSTNTMMDNKAQAAAQTNMTIIQASSGGGGGRSGGNINSATAITNNISQGISADDLQRLDFINPF